MFFVDIFFVCPWLDLHLHMFCSLSRPGRLCAQSHADAAARRRPERQKICGRRAEAGRVADAPVDSSAADRGWACGSGYDMMRTRS